ncbi:hypothetical protein [Nocardia callitridis]|uniref:DUF732 domain-containing protein n=1 Tax=Nocardia callitridis TaxID=648753 RepID=A0ABP9K1R9_9NOCA
MRITLIAAALLALPVLAACGSDNEAGDKDAKAPVTQADISKSLQDKGLKNQELADCSAKVFIDQGISQDGLRVLISEKYDANATDKQNLGMSADDASKSREASSRIATECIKMPGS